MSDYSSVENALKEGVSPELLCATCPWDRLCITPPTMTSRDVDRAIETTAEKVGGSKSPTAQLSATLLSALVYGGRDKTATLCPVFRLRFASPEGRRVVDVLKPLMREWPADGSTFEGAR